MRACRRDTAGSASWSVLPGARPIVVSSRSGTRVRSGSTSSSTDMGQGTPLGRARESVCRSREAAALLTGREGAGGSSGPMRTRAPNRRPWWSRPRLRSTVLLGGLAALTLAARAVARLQTDLLWFHELGQDRVFWTLEAARWLAGGLAGLVTAAFLLANGLIVVRGAP